MNDGSRPSRLDLARMATGELPATPASEAFARQIPPAPPFDLEIIRAASHRKIGRAHV